MKKINWFDHLSNLLVVILGISIAFYLEGYRNDKAAAKQESVYIENLIEDLDVDAQLLDTLLILNEQISNSIVQLSRSASSGTYESDSVLTSQMLGIQYNPRFTSQATTYQSLKSSGKMDLISDFELRTQIIELYDQYYRGMEQYDNAIDQHSRDFIKPFFMKNIRFMGRNQISNEFLNSNEFRNIIFSYRFVYIAKSDFYSTVKSRLDSVVTNLNTYNQLR